MATEPSVAGYSGTPLPKKLGLGDGQVVGFFDLPATLAGLRTAAAFVAVEDVSAAAIAAAPRRFDVLHLFLTDRSVLEKLARPALEAIRRDGTVWISWPKKASKAPTDLSEDVLRDVLLPVGLVDVKVCALDEKWSGLKFVIRKELR